MDYVLRAQHAPKQREFLTVEIRKKGDNMLRVVSGTDYVPIFITLDSIYKCLLST